MQLYYSVECIQGFLCLTNNNDAMKKYFKIVWKSLLAVAAVAVVFIGVVLAYAMYDKKNGYYNKRWLSEDVSVRYYYNKDTHKVYNHKLKKVMLKDVDNVVEANEGDSLTVFFKDDLRGFLNVNTGEVVIPAQYKRAWVFSEGVAAVMDNTGKIGFINKDNEIVLPFIYNYRKEWPIDYYFSNGYCVMTDERGACGMIDKEGNWAMGPRYDCIWKLYFGKYRIVKDGDKYGMIDEKLNFIFPIEYDWIEFAEYEYDGVLLTTDYVKQQVAFDGTFLNPFVINGTSCMYCTQKISPTVLTDGYGDQTLKGEMEVLTDYRLFYVDDLCGVIHNETGEIILPAQFEYVRMVSPSLFEAELDDVDGYVLYDIQGRKIDN